MSFRVRDAVLCEVPFGFSSMCLFAHEIKSLLGTEGSICEGEAYKGFFLLQKRDKIWLNTKSSKLSF